MTQIAIRDSSIPFNVELGSALRLSDDELFELSGFVLDLEPIWLPA
jgi:hypothetical protein